MKDMKAAKPRLYYDNLIVINHDAALAASPDFGPCQESNLSQLHSKNRGHKSTARYTLQQPGFRILTNDW